MENITYILKEYLNFHDKYTEIYGTKTIVIMMCGQFYEIYGVNNDEIQVGPNLNELSDILNISVARRNKNINEISYDNYQMMGWPDHSLIKFQNILLNNGYTIVKVDQVTAPPNPEREVTEIISPSTCIESYDSQDTNYLSSIYINTYPYSNGKKINVAGLSFIDVSTGRSFIHSISSSISDNKIWNDEIYRLIQYYNPKELILHYSKDLNFNKEDISKFWEINENNIHINLTKSTEYHKLSYQNQFLSKIFNNIGNLSPIEYLDLEREPEIILSYIYMIQFIHEHKVENTLSLQKPEFKLNNKYLLLSHNCVEQLNVIDNRKYSNDKYNCLLSLVNKCSTAIGRRLCKERLLYPILDIKTLNKRYDIIELFQKEFKDEKIYNICKSDLSKIIDIEKLHRKMSINILNPYDFYSLHISYQYIKRIFEKSIPISIIGDFMKQYETLNHNFNNLIKEYSEIFNINQLDKCTLSAMDYSVFNIGIYPEIDQYDKEIFENKNKLKIISNKLGFYVDKKKDDTIKISYNDRYGWHLYMTKKRSEILKKNIKNLVKTEIDFGWATINIDDIKTNLKGSNYHLDIPIIHRISEKIS
jgi:DNA mismatch repair protein MutS